MKRNQRYIIASLVYQIIQWVLYFIFIFFIFTVESILRFLLVILLCILPIISPIIYYAVIKMQDKKIKDYLFQLFINYLFNVLVAIIVIYFVGGFSSGGEFANISGVMEVVFAIANSFLFTVITIIKFIIGCIHTAKQSFSKGGFVLLTVGTIMGIFVLLLVLLGLFF